ncbi:MAG: type I-MYXAN CRISPR-associated protein Cas6/Cmx6 [Deltaproteobacteria bacterium]|nr:type I-MYXAN CRISPR-associated protein Cas6/Cmx6 [Deltaproteobacteria bacterium]
MDRKIDLVFKVSGKYLAVDHGFALYSAISRVCPVIHDDQDVGLKLIRGRYLGNGRLDISPNSELMLRLPISRIKDYLGLAGKSLIVQEDIIRIGVPNTRALIPATALFSPLATTKNGQDQTRFECEIKKQMEKLGVKGRISVGKRRTFQVHGKQVVGYEILVSELTASASFLVQEYGLGGRRKLGCGFFEVWKKEPEIL